MLQNLRPKNPLRARNSERRSNHYRRPTRPDPHLPTPGRYLDRVRRHCEPSQERMKVLDLPQRRHAPHVVLAQVRKWCPGVEQHRHRLARNLDAHERHTLHRLDGRAFLDLEERPRKTQHAVAHRELEIEVREDVSAEQAIERRTDHLCDRLARVPRQVARLHRELAPTEPHRLRAKTPR